MAAKGKKSNKLIFVFLFIFLLSGNQAKAQSNYLYRRITVSIHDVPLNKALATIADAGGFIFSYNSKNFDEQRLVSVDVENKTVERALYQLFDNAVRYKVVGSHIVLMKKKPSQKTTKENTPDEYLITGYIIDSRTGEKIKEATVYEVNGQVVSLSDSEGYYSLSISGKRDIYGLSYSKNGYLDTVIMVEPAYKENLDIYLNPKIVSLSKLESKSDFVKLENIHERQVVDILVPDESKIISDNLIIHQNKTFQVSLIPYLGTNRKLSGSVNNTLSFNVLAGYSGGLNGFEIGGLLNIVRRNAYGTQIGGAANIVGGNTGPFQLAGFFNLNGGSVTGTQIAGFSNVVLDTLNGIQIAGFNNTLHGYMNGIQISAFNNFTTQHVDGLQLTGFINVALKDVKLGQLSGFGNYCNNVDGGQVSGFANIAKGDVNWGQLSGFANYGNSVKGFQVAGFVNYSKEEVEGGQIAGGINYGKTGGKLQFAGYGNIAIEEIEGFQLAAYFNYAKKVNGYQIAILNVADTVESGLPIGLFSFVKNGFHRIELSANEVFYLNAAYKLGVQKLHNTIRLGYDMDSLAYAGYSIGTQFALGKKINLNLNASFDFIIDTKSVKYIGNLIKITPTLDYKLGNHFTVFAGPSLNTSIVSIKNNAFASFAPYNFYENTQTSTQTKMWIGGIIGVSYTL